MALGKLKSGIGRAPRKNIKMVRNIIMSLKVDPSKTLKIHEKTNSIKWRKVVSFSKNHNNYYYACKCTCKDATSFHHSKYHINLDNFVSPQIKKSAQANQKHAPENPTNVWAKKQKQKAQGRKHTTQFEVRDVLVKYKDIGTLSSFKKQTKDKKDRQTDMAAFVLFRSNKSLNDLQK